MIYKTKGNTLTYMGISGSDLYLLIMWFKYETGSIYIWYRSNVMENKNKNESSILLVK